VAELGKEDDELRNEIAAVVETLRAGAPEAAVEETAEGFDIYSLYPPEADIPVDLLDDDKRIELLGHPLEAVRAAAVNSFFNRETTPGQRTQLLHSAQQDESATVRARAWEALTSAAEEPEVVSAMLATLRKPDLDLVERGGLLVGLAPEADRNEVRAAIADLYQMPGGRAKALEAMWRSMHPSFRDHFAKHLGDADLEVRRAAVWGVGYYGIKSELEKIRKLFGEEELRSDALFAYALAVPAEVSRGRMKGLLTRIDKDARGLSEMEEELVKAALDERLLLAGKEPFFAQQED
jgi:HEAT repeat protein